MPSTSNEKKWVVLFLLSIVATLLTRCAALPAANNNSGSTTSSNSTGGNATITVASKDFTEEYILGEMYALLLENGGYKVTRKINLGGTPVVQQALLNNQVDLYPEYTGTGLLTVLKLPVMSDPKAVYDKVKSEYEKQFKLTWLEAAPMNNTQALAMTKAKASALGITTISDMVAKANQLILVGPPEFAEREDGIPGLKRVYGNFELKQFLPIDPGLRYQALTSGQADVAVAFGTDGEIAANDLLLLKDDKGLYPPYQVAPVIRQAVLNEHQDIATILNKWPGQLPDHRKRCNNSTTKSVAKNASSAAVAKEFLRQRS